MLTNFLIFAVAFLFFGYLVFRVIVKRDYQKRQKLSPLSYLLELLVFAVHANSIYIVLPTAWPNIPSLPENQILKIIGPVILGAGAIILFIAWSGLGTKSSFGQDEKRLKTNGLYRYSRNPQLVGYGLILFSYVMMYFSYLIIGWFLLYVLISWFMIKSEEEFLRKRYDKEYIEYCRQVPRII